MTDNDTRDREEQLDEVLAAYLEAVESGWAPDRQRLLSCYPHLADDIARYFLNHDRVEDVTLPLRCVSGGNLPASSVTMADTSPVSPNPRWPRVPGYLILEELGRGGMGVVFKARQVSCDRLVALKMVLAGEVAGRQERERFRNEVQAVARLQHTGIVQLYEVGEADGRPFFSMEYVAGGSLEDFLDGTPLPPREAARLIEQLASAVNAAHRAGIVHRDLKPANILLQKNQTTDDTGHTDKKKQPSSSSVLSVVGFLPKVTDFGLAKRLDRQGQTVSGAIVGTPSYMAPEQAASRSKDIGPGTDVYALGALLYECLTGRPPFKAATVLDTVFQVLHEEPIAPSRLALKCPRDLETICLKCLQKAPAQRYAAAEDLAEDLRRFLDGTPIRARPAGAGARAVKWARRHPGTAALVTTCLLSFVALGVGGVWLAREASARADAETRARLSAEEAKALALTQKHEAEQSEARAQVFKREAEHTAVQLKYASQVQLASQQFESGELDRFRKDLELLGKLDSAKDLRGFEWHYLDRQAQGDTRGSTSLKAHAAPISGVVFSPDGKQFATCGADQTVKVWDAKDGKQLLSLEAPAGATPRLMFSADGRWLVSGGGDGSARLWDIRSGKSVKSDTPPLPTGDKVLSPDNRYMACFIARSKEKDGEVRICEVETGRPITDLPMQASYKGARFALGPGGHSLAVLRPEGGEVWDTATNKIVTRLTAPGGEVRAAVFRPDGKLFAVAAGGSVWVGETATGKKILDLHDQSGGVLCLAFSPDGKRLAAGGKDRLVRLWDVATGLNVLRLKTDDVVHTLTFSPDGLKLAAGNEAGRVQLWDANPKP